MEDTDLRLYDVTVNGHPTRMRLNARDAAAMGTAAVLAVISVPAAAPAPGPVPEDLAVKGRPVTSNKMRGTDSTGAL